jgi:hypothetical protein
MARFLFFVLLVACIAFGVQIALTLPSGPPDFSRRERNPDDVHVLAVTPPEAAARAAQETRQAVKSLAGAACVEFAGFKTGDLARARESFGALRLGERLAERRIEEVTRYWVFVPPSKDRRTAEQVAQLKRLGVNDVSVRPERDNAISLGVFSSEDSARRFLDQMRGKGVQDAELGPFTRETRGVAMLVRDPDTETVARLAILQRDFPGAQLRAVTCPTG